jgi:hypothetical protein
LEKKKEGQEEIRDILLGPAAKEAEQVEEEGSGSEQQEIIAPEAEQF